MSEKFLYLFLNGATLLSTLALSFDRKVHFYKKWKYLFPSIAIVASFFIIWDVFFTDIGIWGFNNRYLTGFYIANLPIEEWLFFITIPYSCVFIYEVLLCYFPKSMIPKKVVKYISYSLAILLLLSAAIFFNRLYTVTTFALMGSVLLIHRHYVKEARMEYFYIAYLVILVPFFMVNGILTGSWIEEPVVWYNNEENLGIRLGTVPLEDAFYGMLLVFGNTVLYEAFRTLFAKTEGEERPISPMKAS